MRDDARKGETHTHAHPSKYTIRGERERDQKTQLDSRREKLGQRPTLSLRDCEKSHTRNKAHRTSERGNVSLSAGWLRNRDYAGAPPRSEIALANREFMKLEITPRVEKCRLFLFSLSLSTSPTPIICDSRGRELRDSSSRRLTRSPIALALLALYSRELVDCFLRFNRYYRHCHRRRCCCRSHSFMLRKINYKLYLGKRHAAYYRYLGMDLISRRGGWHEPLLFK